MSTAAEPLSLENLQETVQRQEWTIDLLTESISTLEQTLRADDEGWEHIGAAGRQEFSREGLRAITELSRLYAIKNPVVNRAVSLEAFYVWSQGASVQARHEAINEVLQSFLDDEKNKAELGHQARMEKEVELQTDGNLFFAFFVNPSSGRTRVRSFPFSEVADVICDPEDRKDPWFYKRVWRADRLDAQTGTVQPKDMTAYHPDWRYRPPKKARLAAIGGAPVMWDVPVYHVKVGGFSDWKFGLSEVYAALDWAKAFRQFLENVATLMATLSTFAAKHTTKGGSRAVQAAKNKYGSTVGQGGSGRAEQNPPPAKGSIFLASENANYEPYQLRGASISPEDGRRFLLMVCAATGWPETFFGDASVGALATARSLDRPTELRIKNRQTFWADILKSICGYAVYQAVNAPSGALRGFGRIVTDDEGQERIEWAEDAETEKPINASISVDFPPIVEHDVSETVGSIVSAATLDGKSLAGTLDAKLVTRLMLVALGQDNIDELLEHLFPEGEPTNPGDVPAEPPQVTETLREIRSALAAFVERHHVNGAS